MKVKFHEFQLDRCDWCDTQIPTVDNQLPNNETHGHIKFEFFNDTGARGNRRNLCLDCFNKLCAFEDEQPKMKWLNERVEKLHKRAWLKQRKIMVAVFLIQICGVNGFDVF
jgi:hypothetical protein